MGAAFGALALRWSRVLIVYQGDDVAARVAEVEAIRDAALADALGIKAQASRLAAAAPTAGQLVAAALASARRTGDRSPGGQQVPEPVGRWR